MPPIDGLHDICPSVSMLWVSRSVLRPILAQASAASVPAWPPPTTITSYLVPKIMILLRFFDFQAEPANTRCRRSNNTANRGCPKSSHAAEYGELGAPLRLVRRRRATPPKASDGFTWNLHGRGGLPAMPGSTWNQERDGRATGGSPICMARGGYAADYNLRVPTTGRGPFGQSTNRLRRHVRARTRSIACRQFRRRRPKSSRRDLPNAAAAWRPTRALPWPASAAMRIIGDASELMPWATGFSPNSP